MIEPTYTEEIPVDTFNNDEDYVYDNEAYNNEETTTFTDPTRSSTPYLYDEPTENHPLLSPKPSIEKEINIFEKVFKVEISEEDRSKFRLDGTILQYEKEPKEFVNLTNKKTGEMLAESTLLTFHRFFCL